jgi:hypothetical protein
MTMRMSPTPTGPGEPRSREQRTHDFFWAWGRATSDLSLEEKGAYASIAAQIIACGAPISEAAGRAIVGGGNKRVWRRLRDSLLNKGALVLEDGLLMVPALRGRLYKTGYAYLKVAIPARLRWRVFRRDGYRCVICAAEEDLVADHIIAEISGGETTFDNLQTLCRTCNAKKGAL